MVFRIVLIIGGKDIMHVLLIKHLKG